MKQINVDSNSTHESSETTSLTNANTTALSIKKQQRVITTNTEQQKTPECPSPTKKQRNNPETVDVDMDDMHDENEIVESDKPTSSSPGQETETAVITQTQNEAPSNKEQITVHFSTNMPLTSSNFKLSLIQASTGFRKMSALTTSSLIQSINASPL